MWSQLVHAQQHGTAEQTCTIWSFLRHWCETQVPVQDLLLHAIPEGYHVLLHPAPAPSIQLELMPTPGIVEMILDFAIEVDAPELVADAPVQQVRLRQETVMEDALARSLYLLVFSTSM